VTLDEAFAELGLDPDAGSDGARRAYLRLLKTRKPETDPEGFMRLRAAYDLVKSNAAFFDAFRAREPEVRVAVAEVVSPVSEVASPEGEVTSEVSEVASPEAEVVSEVSEVVSPEAEVASEEAEVVSPEAEVASPEAEVDLGDVDLLESLVARSAYEKAAVQALLIFAAASHRLDQRDPPVLTCLQLMLGLHRISEPEKAREVSKAFKGWLAATGKESTQIRGHAAVLWTLVRELDAMKKGLPDRVRTAIALAALAGDLDLARSDLISFQAKQGAAAQAAGGLLRRKAPVIAAALANTLDPPEPSVPRARTPAYQRAESPNQRGEGSKKGFWFLPMLALGLLRLILAAGRTTTPSYPSYSDPLSGYHMPSPTYPTIGFDAGAIAASMNELERTQLLTRGRQIVRDGTASGRISHRANSVVLAIDEDDCTAALAALAVLDTEAVKIKKTIPPVLSADIILFDVGVHRYCDKHAQADAEAELNLVAPVDAGAKDAGRPGKTVK
jgi:hypothetical protein